MQKSGFSSKIAQKVWVNYNVRKRWAHHVFFMWSLWSFPATASYEILLVFNLLLIRSVQYLVAWWTMSSVLLSGWPSGLGLLLGGHAGIAGQPLINISLWTLPAALERERTNNDYVRNNDSLTQGRL